MKTPGGHGLLISAESVINPVSPLVKHPSMRKEIQRSVYTASDLCWRDFLTLHDTTFLSLITAFGREKTCTCIP